MMKVTREMQNLLSAIKFVRDKRLHGFIAFLNQIIFNIVFLFNCINSDVKKIVCESRSENEKTK